MERIIAVNTNTYHGFGIEETLREIKKTGFRYIELTATKGWTEHVYKDMSFAYLQSIKDLMHSLDLECIGFSGHSNLMDKDRLKDFIVNIHLAKFFGAKYIVSSVGEAHVKDRECEDSDLIKNIKSLLEILKEEEIKLVLETHGKHSNAKVLKDIIDKVDSEYVGKNYDTANVIFYSNVRPENDIDLCIKDVLYMHLKDKAGENEEWNFPALGKGNIDFDTIFRKLSAENNNCPFSIEIEFTEKGVKDINEVTKAVSDSAAYLKKFHFRREV